MQKHLDQICCHLSTYPQIFTKKEKEHLRQGPGSSTRMVLLVDAFQAVLIHMGIDLGGGYIGVAEHFLHHS